MNELELSVSEVENDDDGGDGDNTGTPDRVVTTTQLILIRIAPKLSIVIFECYVHYSTRAHELLVFVVGDVYCPSWASIFEMSLVISSCSLLSL